MMRKHLGNEEIPFFITDNNIMVINYMFVI